MENARGGIRAPNITTTRASRKARALALHPRTVASPVSISRPVPPSPEVPGAALGAPVPEMSLTADRTNYAVSEAEFPNYTVDGAAPNQTILWSMWLNDVSVVSDQSFASVTDSTGNWLGRGSQWTDEHLGGWLSPRLWPEPNA